jgi:hypothetical protein
MEFAQRKTQFWLGLLLLLLPILLWLALPDTLFTRLAIFFRIDERLVDAYCFLGGAIVEMVAIYFFERARKRLWDWLSVCAAVTGSFSVFATIAFWGAATAVVMQGW